MIELPGLSLESWLVWLSVLVFAVVLGWMLVRWRGMWLPAPPLLNEEVTLTVAHDPNRGLVHSLCREDDETAFGLQAILKVQRLPKIQALALTEQLRGDVDLGSDDSRPLIAEIVEYAILEWLRSTHLTLGYHSPSTMPAADELAQRSVQLASCLVAAPAAPERRLIGAAPVNLGLPVGSRACVGAAFGQIQIHTPHSSLEISVLGGSMERFSRPANQTGYRMLTMIEAAGLATPSQDEPLVLHNFRLAITTSQRRSSRLESQARIEARWLDKLRTQFAADFSTARVLEPLQES